MHNNWMRRQRMLGYIFVGPNMLGVLLFFLIPAIYSFGLMFTDYKFMNPDMTFIGLDNIKRLMKDPLFFLSLRNTLIFLLAVPVSIVLGFIVAVILNQKIYLKKLLRGLYFMPYITSGVAVAFVWMLLFQPNQGPINGFLRSIGVDNPPGWLSTTTSSMYAIDIIWIWFMLGYNMIIYLAALQEVSSELLEAAKIDGARPLQILRRIIWPLVSPTTFLLLITGLIMAIKTFGIIQATTQGGPGNSTTILSLYVYQNAFRYYDMGYAATVSWALFAIILLITVLQWVGQKRWVHY
ncbi:MULTISPECIES: carbohydrate ABC transporter permease [Paenibacillus]|jgi:multiple sugar transport system permease protein|uniref:Binding-protein-dependent transport systems inner membrane component n=1 Tax=Paenibacillus illinoisensis TaxID=59845 RepID=A0A2W0C225_9BACL|nr:MULTISPECIES: sugar ABC transporter permease [Paenibacillus]MBM6383760.1 sugar ABC transporter permease [Paenibacillus sp.]PAD32486.1 sugar ABC transporter permease [Paenibacillus sp. 7523-1]PYY26423.1 Binding-protein-dependent transport systems inner membrane component [Paenibacillus illinoisensis]